MNISAIRLDLPRTSAAHRPRSTAAGLTIILAKWAERQVQATRARWQERATRETLSQLTDHLRRDIGLPPSNAQPHVRCYY